MKRRYETSTPARQKDQRPLDPAQRPAQFGPWLTAEHAAWYLDFSTINAFRLWAKRKGIVPAYRDRRPIYKRAVLDAVVEGPQVQPRSFDAALRKVGA